MPRRFAGRSVDKDGPSARRLAAKELEEEAGLDILEYRRQRRNDNRLERYVEKMWTRCERKDKADPKSMADMRSSPDLAVARARKIENLQKPGLIIWV